MSKKPILVRGFFLLLLMSILIFLDQFTKALTLDHLMNKPSINIIDGVLQLHFVSNKGIAWGMFSGKIDILVITTSLITIFIVFLLIKAVMRMFFFRENIDKFDDTKTIKAKLSKNNILQITLVFLIAGAIGNLIDRIRLDYVIDMIYFELIDFPVFNVADIYITCSTIFFIILYAFIIEEDEIFDLFKSRKKWDINKTVEDTKE